MKPNLDISPAMSNSRTVSEEALYDGPLGDTEVQHCNSSHPEGIPSPQGKP